MRERKPVAFAHKSMPGAMKSRFPSPCPRVSRASTACFDAIDKEEGVDGRDTPGHDFDRWFIVTAMLVNPS
jgi:hypothetical protein